LKEEGKRHRLFPTTGHSPFETSFLKNSWGRELAGTTSLQGNERLKEKKKQLEKKKWLFSGRL